MASSNGCVVEAVVQEDPPVRYDSSEETKNNAAQPAAAAPKQDKSVKANKRITGTVKWFNVKDGFGFITRHDTGEDLFVHQSCILRPNSRHSVRSVGEGEVVEFGVIATKVTGPGFQRVKGSAFVRPKSGPGGGGSRGRPKSGSSVRSKRGERRPPKSAPETSVTNNNQYVGDGPIVKEMAQLKLEEKPEEQEVPTEVPEDVVDPLALEEVRVKEEAGEENDDGEDNDDDDDTASVDSTSTVATAESAD
ncbi:Y-box-binding protein 2-A-like [Culex pipiens pallens]|uniref:Y-box-binding protein 2-A-like n=1 Tax=Culex pipiens pallens TaxID=42434 RepID=UPI0019535632|nr:Y-box-binding protein 2-A-like [Culex pipiens pallens]